MIADLKGDGRANIAAAALSVKINSAQSTPIWDWKVSWVGTGN